MKVKFLIFASATILFFSCGQNTSTNNTAKTTPKTALSMSSTSSSCDEYITTDTANKMLKSYLTSISSDSSDTSLHSLILNANCLRDYLNDTTITNVKIMFAHTLDYINKGHGGQNCGYGSGKLTVIIAGYDSAGNYVMHQQNMVIEKATPCPPNCDVGGNASNDLLPQ